jgi:hypothetical protein
MIGVGTARVACTADASAIVQNHEAFATGEAATCPARTIDARAGVTLT